MNESCAIGLPGQRMIGTRVRLVISSVSVPLKPGSTKPAVAWTMRPSRPRELLALDSRDQVVGQLDVLLGAPEHELAGVDDERLAVVELDELGRGSSAGRRGRWRRCDGCGRRGTSCPGAGRRWRAGPSRRPTARCARGPPPPGGGSSRRRGPRSRRIGRSLPAGGV